jgi:hypothetical protein
LRYDIWKLAPMIASGSARMIRVAEMATRRSVSALRSAMIASMMKPVVIIDRSAETGAPTN